MKFHYILLTILLVFVAVDANAMGRFRGLSRFMPSFSTASKTGLSNKYTAKNIAALSRNYSSWRSRAYTSFKNFGSRLFSSRLTSLAVGSGIAGVGTIKSIPNFCSQDNQKDRKNNKAREEWGYRNIKLPSAEEISKCMCDNFDLEHFIEKTHIDEELGEKWVNPLELHSCYIFKGIDRYRKNLVKDGNPSAYIISKMLFDMRKQVISKCILKSHPEAIKYLEDIEVL